MKWTNKLAIERFARKLNELMIAKGFSQSDLAGELWGRTKDSRGYDVARNRDRISVYLKGKSAPNTKTLVRLAAILGVQPDDLMPVQTASPIDTEMPELAMTAIADQPGMASLRVNKLVPIEVAAQVIALLSNAK